MVVVYWIYNEQKEVQINRETIEKYEVIDTIETTTAHTTSSSKGTSRKGTKSLAGRAIVGGVLFGPVGAVVGAATAKNKNKSTTQGTTVETSTREFKVSVTFKDGSQVLLHLDEVGYDNLLVAVFSDPYIEHRAYSNELAEQKRLEDERNMKQMKGCLKILCTTYHLADSGVQLSNCNNFTYYWIHRFENRHEKA